MGLETVVYEIDTRSTLKALDTINQAVTAGEDRLSSHNQKLSDAFAKVSGDLVKFSDKATQSQERFLKSLERQADVAGKSGVDKLIADRDRLIKKYGDDEKAVDRVTAAYKKLIAAEQGGGGNNLQKFGEGLKQFVQNPMQAAGTQATSLVGELTPVAAGLASVAAAGIAVGVALFQNAKGFGEASEQLVNLSASTGITINELDKLQAMAKLTGTEISSITRAATTMDEALEGGGEKGKKLADNLAKLKISTIDFNGAQKSGGQILGETFEALSKVADTTERIGLAAEIMGPKVSKNFLPVIANLDKLKTTVEKLGFGTRENLIKEGAEAAETLHELGLRFDILEGKIAGFTIGAVKSLAPIEDALLQSFAPILEIIRFIDQHNAAVLESEGKKYDLSGSTKLLDVFKQGNIASAQSFNNAQGLNQEDAIKQKIKDLEEQKQKAQLTIDTAARGQLANRPGLLQAEATVTKTNQQIEGQKKLLEQITQRKEFLKQLHDQELSAGDSELSATDKIIAKRDEQIQKAKELGFIGKQLADITATENKIALRDLDSLNKKLDEQQAKELKSIQIAEQRANLHQQQARIQETPIRELGSKGVTAGDIENDIARSAAQKTLFAQQEHDAEVAEANQLKLANGQTDERGKQLAIAKADSELRKQAGPLGQIETDRQKELNNLRQKQVDQLKAYGEELSKITSGQSADDVKARSALLLKVSELNKKDNPSGVIEDAFKIRIDEANQLAQIELDRIQKEETGYQASISAAKALKQLAKETEDAQTEAILKQMELQHHQFEQIKGDVAGLYNTLFTKPGQFGKQLAETIKGAVLKPVTEGLAGVTANALQPLIFGKDGKSGIAGSFGNLFGGADKPNTLVVSNDSNTRATNDNTAVLVGLTNIMSAAMGIPAPSAPSSVAGSSVSLSIPSGGSLGVSSPLGAIQALVGGGGSSPSFFPSPNGNFNGGSSGVSVISSGISFPELGTSEDLGSSVAGPGGPPLLGSETGGIPSGFKIPSGSGLAGILKGFGGPNGFSLSKLKGFNWGSFTHAGDFTGAGGAKVSGGGRITGVDGLAGAALFAGGSQLAEAGLLGNARGTGLGIFEAGAGGAALGLKFGGPIGAAIGAAAGALAGIGEMLAGVESPVNEAKRLVKQKYGVTIDTQFANQVVNVAKQKYGGKVSLAVMDPEIRNALMVYASGTGQKVPLSSTMPHAGNLVSSGGQLQQEASYMFGQAYTYQSNLPTYGNVSSTTLPNNSPAISLHIDGQAAGAFMAGQVVTPDFVQSQATTANNYSIGRVQNSATLNQPLLLV
ncbi:MAG TPA: hypothetical protein VGN17_00405 [Bryobacteraceae bacterium]|jgi:hypothetical protein